MREAACGPDTRFATGTLAPDTTTPAAVRALSVSTVGWNGSAVIIAGRNAGNVRAIKADIGQFAIAKLGQFADIALIVPERLDHADEREQHGVVSLNHRFSLWRKPHR